MAKKNLLKKTKNYNNIPEKYIPEMPEKGTLVTFKLKTNATDPVAGAGGTKKVIHPNHHQFPAFSSFKDEETGEWYNIGMISAEDKEGNPICQGNERAVLSWMPSQTLSIFEFRIGSSSLIDSLYQYLMLASHVGDNLLKDDMRDTSETIEVVYVDYNKDARIKKEALIKERDALKVVAGLSEEQLEEVASVLGFSKLEQDQKETAVWEYAKENPDSFNAKLKADDRPYRARASQALYYEILAVDAEKMAVYFNDQSKVVLFNINENTEDAIQSAYAAMCTDPSFLKSKDAVIAKEITVRKAKKAKK